MIATELTHRQRVELKRLDAEMLENGWTARICGWDTSVNGPVVRLSPANSLSRLPEQLVAITPRGKRMPRRPA